MRERESVYISEGANTQAGAAGSLAMMAIPAGGVYCLSSACVPFSFLFRRLLFSLSLSKNRRTTKHRERELGAGGGWQPDAEASLAASK